MIVRDLCDEQATTQLGYELAERLRPGTVVELNGTLGAGKTHLVRAIAAAWGIPPADVTSPTFTLWQTYPGTRTLHHLDAYRLRDEDEFWELGVADYFDSGIVIIEWGERIANCLPKKRWTITMEVVGENSRRATIVDA